MHTLSYDILIGKDKTIFIVKFTVKEKKENKFRTWIWIYISLYIYFEFFLKVGMKVESVKALRQKRMCYEYGTCYCHRDFISVKKSFESWLTKTDMFIPFATGGHCKDVAWTRVKLPRVALCGVWMQKFECGKEILFMRV